MLTVATRLFTPEEREILRQRGGLWFALWWNRKEMKTGMAEVISGAVVRVWSGHGCLPPCCPNSYLIDTGGERLVAVSTWRFLDGDGEHFSKSSFTVVRTPVSKRVLSASAAGAPVKLSEPSLIETAADTGGGECEILDFESLPPGFKEGLPSSGKPTSAL